jgi:3',5'-cyclic AMP phosphodiesterase CpdA
MNTKAKQISVGADGWHRISVAMKPEVRPDLDRLVELSGAKNLSALVAALASDPERTAQLLAPVVAEARAAADAANPKRTSKKAMAEITKLVKEGKVAPEDLTRALAEIQAKKG